MISRKPAISAQAAKFEHRADMRLKQAFCDGFLFNGSPVSGKLPQLRGRAIAMLRLRCAALAFVCSILVAAPATAGERFALVIGNQAYKANVGPLKNPHNDIGLVGNALRVL